MSSRYLIYWRSIHLRLHFLQLSLHLLNLNFYPFTVIIISDFPSYAPSWFIKESDISLLMKSRRVLTLFFASTWSCSTKTGPTSLYTIFFGPSWSNSWKIASETHWFYATQSTFLTNSFSDNWASSRCLASTSLERSACSFWYSTDACCNLASSDILW